MKIHLIIYSILIASNLILGGFLYYYRIKYDKLTNENNILQINLSNTQLSLLEANKNIDKANMNLDDYIKLNNQLNEQIKLLNDSTNIYKDIDIEMKQINCLFENITKKGNCINGQFIKD